MAAIWIRIWTHLHGGHLDLDLDKTFMVAIWIWIHLHGSQLDLDLDTSSLWLSGSRSGSIIMVAVWI